jgi:hypothetical protein
MASVMDRALTAAAAADSALSFVVIVPSWSVDKASACDGLERSSYLQRRSIARNRRHDYCEGAQYKKRVGQHRRSTCDTAIYFLQTASAARRWPVTDDACEALLSALAGSRAESLQPGLSSSPPSGNGPGKAATSSTTASALPTGHTPKLSRGGRIDRNIAIRQRPASSSRGVHRSSSKVVGAHAGSRVSRASGRFLRRSSLLGWALQTPMAKLRCFRFGRS